MLKCDLGNVHNADLIKLSIFEAIFFHCQWIESKLLNSKELRKTILEVKLWFLRLRNGLVIRFLETTELPKPL